MSRQLVGRATELDTLLAAAAELADGIPSVVLVTGEVGIGKSSLVAAFAEEQFDLGVRVLVGGCVQLAGDPIPYAPLAEILRRLDRTDGEATLGSQAKADLDYLLGARNRTATVDRGELFERTLRLFDELIRRLGRIVLVFEDLHWADQATLDFIAFLTRNLPTGVLVVLTYRNDEIGLLSGAARRAGAALAQLRHPPDRTRPALAPRGPAARRGGAGDTVAGRRGRPAVRPLRRKSVHRPGTAAGAGRCGLAVLTGRSAARPGAAGGLGRHGEEIIRLAAVIGRSVDHEVLVRASELAEDAMIGALREAVTCGLLTVEPDRDAYVFRHVLTQEAMQRTLLPGERRRLHGAVALGDRGRPRHLAQRQPGSRVRHALVPVRRRGGRTRRRDHRGPVGRRGLRLYRSVQAVRTRDGAVGPRRPDRGRRDDPPGPAAARRRVGAVDELT